MPLVPIRSLVRPGRALGAFNMITLEHGEAIVAGAESAGLPAALQISQNCVRYHGALLPVARAAAALAEGSAVAIALHLDHVEDRELLAVAAPAGFGSVMVDASRLPYEQNVATTRAAAQWAHARGMWLEAELGQVGGKGGAHAPGARTDPAQAAAFVAATGADALAVAVGSSHAMTTRTAVLDHDLIARLAAAVAVPLVLHGSSGVPDGELRRAVRGGIAKANIGTALNLAFTAEVRRGLAADAGLTDPRRYLAGARGAMAGAVARLLAVLASSTDPSGTGTSNPRAGGPGAAPGGSG